MSSFILLFVGSVIPERVFANDVNKVTINDFPSKDLPSDIDKENLIGEPSKNFYYGIGVPVDYVKVRYAAFLEMENLMENETERQNDETFGGSNILMMIYANGLGVQRNLDLSIRLAQFNVPGTQEEIQNRIDHLKRLKWFPFTKNFDFCDDVVGDTEMRMRCEFLKAERKEEPYETELDIKLKKIKGLTNNWSSETIKAFNDLKKAANNYFYKRIYKEVDSSGSERGEIQSEEDEKLQNAFVDAVNKFEKGTFTHFSSHEVQELNSELDRSYRDLLESNDEYKYTSINPIGIRITQRRWIVYRDAWIKFASIRYPSISTDSFKGWLIKQRLHQLP